MMKTRVIRIPVIGFDLIQKKKRELEAKMGVTLSDSKVLEYLIKHSY